MVPITESEAPWVEVTDGVELRLLRVTNDGSGYTALFRFAPGTRLPPHHHMGSVHAYTLEGRWHYLEHDWVAEPGSYVFEPAGSAHTLEVPADSPPAVVLFVVEGGMVILDDAGAPSLIWDTKAMSAIYESSRAS
jgi:quercetin dioxygenase-like cupin family protein